MNARNGELPNSRSPNLLMMVAEYKNEFECLVSRVEDQFVDKLPKAILDTDA